MEPLTSLSTIFHALFDRTKKFLISGAALDCFSTTVHKFLELINKVMDTDAVSTFIHTISGLIKKLMASDAISDIIHKLSDLIQKLMAFEAVSYVVKWFNKNNVTSVVAVVVIGLLIYSFCTCLAKKTSGGKTMKAPGRNYRMPRKGFEENPSAYFRNLRNK